MARDGELAAHDLAVDLKGGRTAARLPGRLPGHERRAACITIHQWPTVGKNRSHQMSL